MATPKSAQSLLDALRAEGLDVVEVGQWRTHNRNNMGKWGPLYGVMNHHTVTRGSANTVRLCYNGHEDLPGPLCHGVITKDGRIHLVGWGRANHAGKGDPDVLAAVKAESYAGNPPVDNEALVDGNPHFIGFECENMGDGQDPWPRVQYIAMVKANAAVERLYGWTEKSSIAHKEWQPGKVDPRGEEFEPMSKFRTDIETCLAMPPGVWNGEDDVALTDEDKDWFRSEFQKIAPAVWKVDDIPAAGPPFNNSDWDTNKTYSARYALGDAVLKPRQVRAELAEVKAAVEAVETKVDAITVGGIDLDLLAQKVADEMHRRMAG